MKYSEIKDLTSPEIEELISETKMNLVKLRINHKVSDLDNPKELTKAKKLIARLKTEMRQRELKSVK